MSKTIKKSTSTPTVKETPNREENRLALPANEKRSPERPSIPLYRDELVELINIARAVDILDMCAHESIDRNIGDFEWLTKKANRIWELALDKLSARWEERNAGDRVPIYGSEE